VRRGPLRVSGRARPGTAPGVTDLPGAPDDEDLPTSEDRMAQEVAGDDTLGHAGGGRPRGDSAVTVEEGGALAPPD
jgi:hypothetical protein